MPNSSMVNRLSSIANPLCAVIVDVSEIAQADGEACVAWPAARWRSPWAVHVQEHEQIRGAAADTRSRSVGAPRR
jgi:hypothetical protein